MSEYSDRLKILEDNADYFKKKYGSKKYNRSKKYLSFKYSSEGLGNLVDTSRLDKLEADDKFYISKYGQDQYDKAYKALYDTAAEEYDTAVSTYQSIANKYNYADLPADIAKDYSYTGTYEDKVRQQLGLIPASFDLNKYSPDPTKPLRSDLSKEEIDSILKDYSTRQMLGQNPFETIKNIQQAQPNWLNTAEKAGKAEAGKYIMSLTDQNNLTGRALSESIKQSSEQGARVQAEAERINQIYPGFGNDLNFVASTMDNATNKELETGVAKWITYIGVDSGESIPYQDLYAQVYGKAPTTKDMLALSNRITGWSTQYQTGFDDPNAIGGGGGGRVGGNKGEGQKVSLLNEQDQAFLDQAKKIYYDQVMATTAEGEKIGEKSSPAEQIVAGGANRSIVGAGNSVMNLAAKLIGGPVDLFTDSRAVDRWRKYQNSLNDLYNSQLSTQLQSAPGYEAWHGSAQNIMSQATNLALMWMSGKVAGAIKPSAMLKNPAIKPNLLNKIAPSPELKFMLAERTGSNIRKYEDMGAEGMAPVYALLDASLETYWESQGGMFSENSAFKTGMLKTPVNYLKAWGKNFIAELPEEYAQAYSSGTIESIASGNLISETGAMSSFTDPKQLAETGISLAIMTALFGLSEFKSNKVSAIQKAYEQGDLQKAAQLSVDAIAEVNTTGEDAQTFNLISTRLNEFVNNYMGQSIKSDAQEFVAQAIQQAMEPPQAPVSPVVEAAQNNVQTPAKPQNAQGMEPPASGIRQAAVSLSEKYAGTEYGNMLAGDIENGKYNYTPESSVPKLEKAVNDAANGIISYNDYNTVYEKNGALKAYNAQDVANLVALIDKANAEGNTEARDTLTAALVESGTELGRAVQAYALLKTASPEAHLAAIQRELERFNAKGREKKNWTDVALTEEETQAILAGTTYADRNALYQQAIERINQTLPSTAWEKFDQIRKTGMLLNLKTQARNIAGNAAYEAMNAISRKIEAGLQKFLPKEQRTVAGFASKKAVKGDWDNVVEAFKNQGRFNMEAKLGKGYSQAFKNKGIGKILNGASKLVGWSLDIGDVVFGKHHYETALASYIKAKGLTEITADARAYAMERALEATFRADSDTANWINSKIKKGGVAGKAISFVMPFTKTPINIAKEAASFSPLGLGKSILIDTIRLKAGKIDATTYIHSMAKGLTGSIVTALGFLLAKGIIPGVELTGAPPEDKEERKFLMSQGWQPYSIKINDTYIPISWAQPVATTLLMGTAISDTVDTGSADFNDLIGIADVMINSIVEVSPMSGVKDVLTYSGDPSDVGIDILANLGSQFVPAISKQLANTIDPKKYEMGSGLERFKNTAVKGIPFLDDLLKAIGLDTDVAQKVDSWGQPEEQGNLGERAALNMVSPANVSSMAPDPVNDELQRLFDATGDNAVFPKLFDNKQMSNKENQKMQEGAGQASRILVEQYINSEEYKTASDSERVKKIKGIYDDVISLYKEGKGNLLSGDYGVDSPFTDELFTLYQKTGDDIFLLADDTVKKNGKVYELDNIREDVFKGYESIPGLDDVMSGDWFNSQSADQQTEIIKDTINDIYKAVEEDVLRMENIYETPKVETKNYDVFSSPGWSGYNTNDKVITKLVDLNVYPKTVDDFNSVKLLEGGRTLTKNDKIFLADTTYAGLMKYYNDLDADIAQKIINRIYGRFKDALITGYDLDKRTRTDILNDLEDYMNK